MEYFLEISRASIADENQLKAKLASLDVEQTYLASSTAELGSQKGIEYDLQENFGAVLPGEKEIVIVNSATFDYFDSRATRIFRQRVGLGDEFVIDF